MRDQIRIAVIRSAEELQSLSKFAASFDHTVGPDSIMPIYTLSRGERLFGYFNVLGFPVTAQSFHTDPEICSKRDILDASMAIKSHFMMQSISPAFPNGTWFTAIPVDTPFPDEVLTGIGLTKTNKMLWQAR